MPGRRTPDATGLQKDGLVCYFWHLAAAPAPAHAPSGARHHPAPRTSLSFLTPSAPMEPIRTAPPQAPRSAPHRSWVAPEVKDLPRLTELTLQTGGPIGCGTSTVCG